MPLRQHRVRARMGGRCSRDPGARVQLLVLPQAWRGLDIQPNIPFGGGNPRSLARFKVRVWIPYCRFHVCSRCGAVPLVTSEIANHLYAVVNVNVLENVDQTQLRKATVTFEGEDVESRLARRQRHWIADVRIISEGGA